MHPPVYLCILGYIACMIAQGDTASINTFCKGRKTGNYPDPERCEGYITCSSGYLYKMPCPANLHYNPKIGVCDWQHNLDPKCEVIVSPCSAENGGCSQTCSNVGGKAVCGCKDGFRLNSDGKTCKKEGDGSWGAWTAYSTCSRLCGGGSQERNRLCDTPVPSSGGSFCLLNDGTTGLMEIETRQCNTQSCGELPYPPPPPLPPGPEAKCGTDKMGPIERIIDGTEAIPQSWPWQGGLYYESSFICGGSLIQPDVLLTAAHCVNRRDKIFMTVRMGDHERYNEEGTEQEFKVTEVMTHEDYDGRITNDIAILKLEKAFELNENVGTICLPKANEEPPADATCYITGWGITDINSDEPSNTLQEAKMPIVSNTKCGRRNVDSEGDSIVTDKMVCAGYEGPDRFISGCKGDSGGPLVCKAKNKDNWVLQGVVSWGSRRCDVSHRYTVFTRVSKYRNWIDERSFPDP